jgi:ATP-dependent Clp protease ATP-binding subunit ClpA
VFERFTDRARSVLVLAQEEARQLGHGYTGTEHILLGLLLRGDGVGAEVLTSFGLTLDAVRDQVQAMVGEGHESAARGENAAPPFTPRAKKVLELSLREALQLGHNYIGTEHILLGIIREGEGVAAQTLTELGVDLAGARQRVVALVAGQARQARHARKNDPVEMPVVSQFVRVDRASPIGRARADDRPGTVDRLSTEPRCPQCRADVSGGARFRTILVQPDASSEDATPLRTYVIYCSRCGISLHIFTPGADT